MKKIILSILCVFMFFSLATSSLTAYAAQKNTITTSISKVESKGKAFKVTWKKKSKIKGYQIQYSTSSKFKKKETKTKTITKAKTTSATVSKLKGCNIKYYVRVRTYKIVNGKKIYSESDSIIYTPLGSEYSVKFYDFKNDESNTIGINFLLYDEKETPCLVPYSELSEEEKEYDRKTAMETIKLIVKLGYRIEKL